MDNFLSASGLLVMYLQQQIKTVPSINIRPAVSIEWAMSNALSPAINIIFVEDQPDMSDGGSRGRGKVQASNQFWLVLLSVRNVADAGTAAQIDSGELIGQLLVALQGHELSAQHQPLYRQKCPFRKTDKSGFTYFPFLFSTKVITGANRG